MGLQVIKLGGSLAASTLLANWLMVIEKKCQNQTVIVPGGGVFSDQVRTAQQQWQFDDDVAHIMALLGMQQMAWLFHGLNRKIPVVQSAEEIKKGLQLHKALIWSPDIQWLNECGVPASWDITSDSLAAWLARKLAAVQLIMVKSVEVTATCTLSELSTLGIVDKAFYRFCQQGEFNVEFLNRNDVFHLKTNKI